MAKKQKQIPVKQQMYEQILTKQLYGDPKDNIAKIQADYESWKARQDDIAKIQADYEAWSKAQQQPVEAQPIETPQIEKPVVESKKVVKNTTPKIDRQSKVEVKAPEEKKTYLTHADIIPTLTKVNVDKQRQKLEKQEKKKANEEESIKKIAAQLNISEAEVKARMQEPKNEAFVSPDSVNLTNANKELEKEKLKKYLDPNLKLTKREKREAKELVKKVTKEVDKETDSKNLKPMSDENKELAYLAAQVRAKTNPFYNATVGFFEPYERIVRPIDKKLNNLKSNARYEGAKLLDNIGITENAKEDALRKNAEELTALKAEYDDMDLRLQNAKTQNTAATAAGNLTGMMSQYYLTSPLFDSAAGALGITGRAGKFLVNQLAQNAQDVALDTLPHYAEYMEDGVLTDEEKNELKKDALWNAVGNLIPGLISEGVTSAKAAKVAKENKAAKAVMESAAQKIPDISDMTKWNSGFMPNAQNALYDTSSARKAIDNALNAEDIAKQVEVPKAPEIEVPKAEVPKVEATAAQAIDNVPQKKVIAAEMEGYKSDVPSSRAAEPIEESWELKERGQSKHIRGEGKMQMEGVSDEVVADFQDEPQLYAALKNSETKAKAENIYNTSNNPEVDFRDMLRNHDPAALPLGHQLAKDYSAAGNHEAAAQIYREMGEQLTKAGQFSQAAAINMMKNDPLTALQYAQRQLDTLNQQGAKRFGKRWKDFKLTDDEIKMFDDIAPGDEEAIKEAFDTIGVRLGKEYPTTFMDKILEGRKIAMLFNTRTNVRNLGANVPTLGMRWASDRFEALGQNAAHLINPDFKVTQSITGSGVQGRKIATQVYNSPKLKAMIEGTNGKYEIPELKNSLVKNKQMYKGTIAEKWLDRVTGNAFNKIAELLKKDVRIDGGIQAVNKKLYGKEGVESALETIRNTTYKLLDLGDSPFVRENFIERLGSYIHAQGIKSVDDVPEEAIATAWEEAMKATYKDDSWAVKMLSGIKSGAEKIPVVGRPISQAAIPFLQAPGNIAARMVDYSPIRGTKGIADIIRGANSADENLIRKGIEEASKGLTGSLMILLGMKLRQAGLITGTYSKDKDQKAFEKQNGFKEFALHVKDKYFTYDWAQPFAQSMIVGTLLQDAIEKSDEYDSDLLAYIDSKAGTNFNDSFASKALGVAGEGAKASLNSWFNASPLQGLSSLLSGNYTDKDDIASSVKQTLVDDFLGAFVPATVNATAKSIDPVQRNTTDKTSATATFVNQQIAKLPGLSKMLPAKYDTWGNEMKYADSKEMAAASRFLIPGEYSYDKTDSIDKEINRLYEATGNAAVFPPVSPNNVGDKKLNNKETSIHQKDMGERSRALVEEFIKSDSYKNMDDADIAEVIPKLYGVSKAITDRDKFGKEPAQNSEYNKPIAEYDNAGGGEKGVEAIVKYYNAKSTADATGFASNSNASKAIQEDMANGNTQAAEKKVDAAQQIQSLGLEKPGPTYTYYNAEKVIPGLTPEKFVSTYKSIDTDGNQGIKQDELIDYLNSHNLSESEGKKIWNAYGNSDWKSIPSLNDGKWTKQKKK